MAARDEMAEWVLDTVDEIERITSKIPLNWNRTVPVLALTQHSLDTLFTDTNSYIPRSVAPEFLRAPLHISLLVEKPDHYLWMEAEEIFDIRNLRGKVRQYCPITSKLSILRLRRDGKVDLTPARLSDVSYIGYLGNRRWTDVSIPLSRDTRASLQIKNARSVEEITAQMGLMCGHQFSHEYEWRVTIGYRNSLHIILPTNASGVAQFLAMRDSTPDRSRRAALRHWVEQHWRTLPSDRETETRVRAHMRGQERYTWGDMDGTIIPAMAALEAAQEEQEISSPMRRKHDVQTKAEALRRAHEARATAFRLDYMERLASNDCTTPFITDKSDQ